MIQSAGKVDCLGSLANGSSLIPRLLPSFLSHTVQKMGREPGRYDHVRDDVLCMVLVIELLHTHAVLECITVLETVGVALLTFIALKMTGRRPQRTTVSLERDCYNMNTGISTDGGFKWQTFVGPTTTFIFRVVHRSCVVSVDQVDTCRETKYLTSAP